MNKQFTLIYTTINHDVRRKHDLLLTEYVLLDMIYHLQTNPKSTISGWCYMSRETMGNQIGITKRGVMKMIQRLSEAGFIEVQPETKFVRTTEKWFENYFSKKEPTVNQVDQAVNLVPPSVNSVPTSGELSTPNINKDINSNNKKENNVPTSVGTSSEKNEYDKYFKETSGGRTVSTKKVIDDIKPKKETLKRAAAASKILYTDFKNKDDAKQYFEARDPLHVGIAYDFHFQFVANCRELDVPTTSVDKANIKKDIEIVRLMFERDGANVEQFIRALKVLKVDGFWKKNCQSIDTLRKQFTKLAAKNLEKNAKTNSTEPTMKALNHDYIPPSY